MIFFPNQISTRLRDDSTLEIYIDNRIAAEVSDGREDYDFVLEILNGMGYEISDADFTLNEIKPDERKYTYSQSSQLAGQTGFIGYLRGDFGKDGDEFFTTWNDWDKSRKSQEFKNEFDKVINELRKDGGVLNGITALSKYCYSHPDASFRTDRNEFGIRVDTAKHSCLFRLMPNKGDYNFYIHCFDRSLLDRHMKAAEKGIRFIDPHYKEKFRLTDGDSVRIVFPDGTSRDRVCRYIDEYHLEVGNSVYHICELAELMEDSGKRIIPLRSDLPDRCYAVNNVTGEVVILKKGETGFYKTDIPTGGKEDSRMLADEYNKKLGVTKAQAAAMYGGSLYGFDTPCADPKMYDSEGTIINIKRTERDTAR